GLKGTVEFFAGPKSRMQILNLLQDHVTHHRGQLIVYLNLNSIEPPQYSGW
ncbi:MAG: putative damage-inducible protein DinB, partial [Gammaproteobacteria bacterium]